MTYYIRKNAKILKKDIDVYYQGNCQWTTEIEFKKIYETKEDAKKDLYDFGGEVVSE